MLTLTSNLAQEQPFCRCSVRSTRSRGRCIVCMPEIKLIPGPTSVGPHRRGHHSYTRFEVYLPPLPPEYSDHARVNPRLYSRKLLLQPSTSTNLTLAIFQTLGHANRSAHTTKIVLVYLTCDFTQVNFLTSKDCLKYAQKQADIRSSSHHGH
jgi:hypothetical protein